MTHLSDDTLNLYLDSALRPVESAEVEAHLAVCPECAARVASLRAVFASLNSLPDLATQLDLATRVVAAIRAQTSLAPLPPASPLPTPLPLAPLLPSFRLALGLQALLALILLAAALPFLLQSLTAPQLAEITAEFTVAFADLLKFDFSDLQPTLDPSLVAAPALSLPPLPTLSLVTIVLATGLLWLVGNGLLLRKTPNLQKR